MEATYIETNCTFEHEGHAYKSGGAVVTPDYAIAYLKSERTGELVRDLRWFVTDWHGKELGSARITASWSMPHSWVSSRQYQVEAIIDGVTYTGRSMGEGMAWKGKRKRTH